MGLERAGRRLEMIELDMSIFGFDVVSEDDFGDEFELTDSDIPQSRTMTFTLSESQYELISETLEKVEGISQEGNTNKNGNKLYEVILKCREVLEI